MPSRPFDTGWDFGPVLDLIESEVHVPSPPSVPRDRSLAFDSLPLPERPALRDRSSTRSVHLGDFDKIYAALGMSLDGPLLPIGPPELELEEPSSSDDAVAAFSSDEAEALKRDVVRLTSSKKKDIVRPSSPKKTDVFQPVSPKKKDARPVSPRKDVRPASPKKDVVQPPSPKKNVVRPVSPKKKPVGQLPKESFVNIAIERPATPPTPPSPTKESDSLMPSGLTKTQRKKWRRKQEKLRIHEELEELSDTAENAITQLLREERGEAQSSPGAHPMQTRAQSRSNVGAKIRPVSPTKDTPYIPTPCSPKLALASPANTPCPSANPYAAIFKMPKKIKAQEVQTVKPKQSVPTTDIGYFPPQTPDQKPKVQQYTVSTPVTQFVLPSPLILRPAPQASSSAVHGHGLVPRTVQPVLVPRSQKPVATPQKVQLPIIQPIATPQTVRHSVLQPVRTPFTPGKLPGHITIRPKVERHLNFFNQLVTNFPEELPWLVSPMQLCNDKAATEGIHVFVDASNIMIGFRFAMKKYRVAPFEISFDSLALLMERRRPVAKRVFAGSHREADPLPHVTKLQQVSKAVGYENNVIEQVYIRREETERRRFFKDVERIGFQKAVEKSQSRRDGDGSGGSGSDSETGLAANATSASSPMPTHSAPKWVEQGVDEILHLKMCQSIIDTEVPSTMVLATGDGAQAEHSDGFLAQVERALKKGWNVELVSWKLQTNGGYKNKKFRSKWGDRFRIIELDEYLEGLIDTP